jgi:hypothetical protein
MTKPCYDDRHMIQLVAVCRPSPISAAGAEHRASLDNHRTGYLYDAKPLVVLATSEWSQCAIAIHVDEKNAPSAKGRIGTVDPLSTGTWSVPVKRTLIPGSAESIETVVDFTTSPSGPLHHQAVPRKQRSCICSVKIAQ